MLQKKIIWKLNIIDLLLLLIIVLSIAALIYKSVSGNTEDDYREFTVTYVCENAPIGLFDSISENAACIDGGTGEEIGVLDGFEKTPLVEAAQYIAAVPDDNTDENIDVENPDENADDEENTDENTDEENEDKNNDGSGNRRRATPAPSPTPRPTRAKAEFRVKVDAAQTEHGIRIDRNVYLIGQSMQLVIGNTVFDVYISSMN